MFSVCPYVCLSANKVTLTKLQTDIDEIFCDEAIVNTCSDFIHSCNRFIPSVVQTNQNTLSILARRLLSLYFFLAASVKPQNWLHTEVAISCFVKIAILDEDFFQKMSVTGENTAMTTPMNEYCR